MTRTQAAVIVPDIKRDGSVADIPDIELLRRAVMAARDRGRRGKHPRWTAVMHTFQLGSTYAWQLCRRFDLDPDEVVK